MGKNKLIQSVNINKHIVESYLKSIGINFTCSVFYNSCMKKAPDFTSLNSDVISGVVGTAVTENSITGNTSLMEQLKIVEERYDISPKGKIGVKILRGYVYFFSSMVGTLASTAILGVPITASTPILLMATAIVGYKLHRPSNFKNKDDGDNMGPALIIIPNPSLYLGTKPGEPTIKKVASLSEQDIGDSSIVQNLSPETDQDNSVSDYITITFNNKI